MKRPAFQFYPGDWLRDVSLRRVSPTSRALWIDMLCLMHDGDPYGHLRSGGADIAPGELARATGFTLGEARRAIHELERAGVFSRTPDGTIYSRRMVRDESLRSVRGASGRLGGNPNLVNQNSRARLTKNSDLDNQTDNQKPTPAVCSLQRNYPPITLRVMPPHSRKAGQKSAPSCPRTGGRRSSTSPWRLISA